MPNERPAIYEALSKKIAHLYLSSELPEDGPVEPVEVVDALIAEARKVTGEAPEDV